MSGQRKPGRIADFDLRDTAHHEAAHAVAAHFHQVPTRKVTIRPEPGNLGHHHHGVVVRRDIEWDSSDRNRLRAERLALVCLAGPYATRRFLALSNRRRAYRHEQHASDYHSAIDVLSYFAGGAVLEKYLHYIEARAEAFVTSHWWAITVVAKALLHHTTLRGAAVKQIIAEAVTLDSAKPIPR
jgi:hypothetical protein